MFTFVDAAFDPSGQVEDFVGKYDFGGLLARVKSAVEKTGAQRVALDSIGTIFSQFPDPTTIRTELYRIARVLKDLGVTVVITAERLDDYGDVLRYNVEEFVADSVVVLRNVLQDEKRRRTVEILKSRGVWHQKGEFPLTIVRDGGLIVVPLSAEHLEQPSSDERASSGVAKVDEMCTGGFFRDSLVLVSGATGAGKTLLVTHFLEGGHKAGERVLLFAFEESRQQLGRNATGWGIDLDAMEAEGCLRIVCAYPEAATPEDHLLTIQRAIEDFKPDRVAIDSLSALERITNDKSFRELVIGLSAFINQRAIMGLITATTDRLMGATAVTDAHISTVTDTIILLRYVEHMGEVLRGITILKMRGSMHDKGIRQFTIDGTGMQVGSRFTTMSGILSGVPNDVPTAL